MLQPRCRWHTSGPCTSDRHHEQGRSPDHTARGVGKGVLSIAGASATHCMLRHCCRHKLDPPSCTSSRCRHSCHTGWMHTEGRAGDELGGLRWWRLWGCGGWAVGDSAAVAPRIFCPAALQQHPVASQAARMERGAAQGAQHAALTILQTRPKGLLLSRPRPAMHAWQRPKASQEVQPLVQVTHWPFLRKKPAAHWRHLQQPAQMECFERAHTGIGSRLNRLLRSKSYNWRCFRRCPVRIQGWQLCCECVVAGMP